MGTICLEETSTRIDTEVSSILCFTSKLGCIACIKHGPCQDLLQHLNNYDLSDDQVNLFEDNQDEDVEMEDRSKLQVDEDNDVLIDIQIVIEIGYLYKDLKTKIMFSNSSV